MTALPPVVFWIWSAVCACAGMGFLLLCQLLAGSSLFGESE